MKHIKNIKEQSSDLSKEHLMITHHESGDEIHFTIVDNSLYPEIDRLRSSDLVEDMLNLIYNNTLSHIMCQTHVLKDWSKMDKYNIVKCIYLPQLGE